MDDFLKPKIVWKRIGSIIRFSYIEEAMYTLDSNCFLTGKEDLKFLLGCMHSKMSINWLLKNSPQTGTGDVIISVQALEPLPIPNASKEDRQKIAELTEQLLANCNGKEAARIQVAIDRIIYAAYGFSQKEVAFIEKT